MIKFTTYQDVQGMKPYRKRPVVIYAMQIHESFEVETIEGIMQGKAGDWLIKGVTGELYICAGDVFAATYDPDPPPRLHLPSEA